MIGRRWTNILAGEVRAQVDDRFGWMAGRMAGRMDGWMDGWTDDGLTDVNGWS